MPLGYPVSLSHRRKFNPDGNCEVYFAMVPKSDFFLLQHYLTLSNPIYSPLTTVLTLATAGINKAMLFVTP